MRPFLPAVILAMLVCMAVPGFGAQRQTGNQKNLITMNFKDVDISTLTQFISRITGKNFVLDDSVRGKVSVIAPAKVTPTQAYCIFLSALQLKGFAAISAGPVIRIVPSRDARSFAPVTNSQNPAGECAETSPAG
jgi:general secretion pathway protein D